MGRRAPLTWAFSGPEWFPPGAGPSASDRPSRRRPRPCRSSRPTNPMWMITQSPGSNVSSGSMPMLTLRCLAGDVDERQLVAVAVEHPHHLAGNPQTHRSALPRRGASSAARPTTSSTARTAPGTAAATASDSPMPSSTRATSQPTTTVYGGGAAESLAGSRTPPPDPCACASRPPLAAERFDDRPRRRAGCRAHRGRAARRRAPARRTRRAGRRPGACPGSRNPIARTRRVADVRGATAAQHLGSEAVVAEEDVADAGDQTWWT